MSVTVFIIAFTISMLGLVLFLVVNLQSYPVVKAGKVSKTCARKRIVFCNVRRFASEADGKHVRMVVNGNSMKCYKIIDGQVVIVKKYSPGETANIQTHPVIVFHIKDNPNTNDAEYKLRKYVGRIRTINCEELYSTYQERIKISKEKFIAQCMLKFEKLRGVSEPLVLSETYDEDKQEVVYSMHPVSSIYGKVISAIGNRPLA